MFDFTTPAFDPNSVDAPGMVSVQSPLNYSPYLSMFSGGFGAASTLLASNKSAQLMRANAQIAGDQAVSTVQAGSEQAELMRQRANQTIGRQVASVGGSNVTMSGSSLRAIENTADFSAQAIAQEQTNAARRAWGYRVQQDADQLTAKQDTSAGIGNALGGLITSSARAYGQWQTTN